MTTPNAPERILAQGVDDEIIEHNRRLYTGWRWHLAAGLAVCYALFHLLSLNFYPIETWSYRILHIAGALILGFAFFDSRNFADNTPTPKAHKAIQILSLLALLLSAYAGATVLYIYQQLANGVMRIPASVETWHFGYPLLTATLLAVALSWLPQSRRQRHEIPLCDAVLCLIAIISAAYLLRIYNTPLRMSTGTNFAPIGISFAAAIATVLILELTRRMAGLALVIIAAVFLLYVFVGKYLPSILTYTGFSAKRFFSQIYTDIGVLGQTTAVSSTYIILFIIFAAFLQLSKVGDYFVNFAFAVAGRARGGPAKVAIFASGLMGMINGTSAGNVVATGSLTIPLMKKVGYPAKSAGAIEAAASTGGQIMPPIMGAGAFLMAEITGTPYQQIAIAAIIPAVLYFLSVYFMVDLEAAEKGMRGMDKTEIPVFKQMLKQIYLFSPILILIYALFAGYSVIRAGTLATLAAAIVSWLTPHKMGIRAIIDALRMSAMMSIQIITVCACAGLIVGVISLTGLGARFSSLLLDLAGVSQLLALFFAMCIAILLGMGMPTTAAYAVAASVVAPGLINIGISPLIAHFFVFYFAVLSAITPPVALAAYAAASISGDNPMRTSVASFKIGLAAFIVPFMFYFSPAMLMQGSMFAIAHVFITASFGIYLLAAAMQGYYFGQVAIWQRALLTIAALVLIYGGWITDLIGFTIAALLYMMRRSTFFSKNPVS